MFLQIIIVFIIIFSFKKQIIERSVSTVAEQSEAVQGFYEVCSYITGWMDGRLDGQTWMDGQTDVWVDG